MNALNARIVCFIASAYSLTFCFGARPHRPWAGDTQSSTSQPEGQNFNLPTQPINEQPASGSVPELNSSRLPARLPAYPFFLMDSISRRMRGGRSVQCLWQAISREYIRAMQ